MARIRSVKPEICTHDIYAALSDGAERTLVRLWTHADDEGRGIDNVKLVKAAIYPLNDEKTEQVIDALMDELEVAGRVWRYVVGGRRFFEVQNFPEHQKPRHPPESKYPAPPADFAPPAPRDHVPPTRCGETPTGNHLCTAGEEGLVVGDGVGEGGDQPERAPSNRSHPLLAPGRPLSLSDELDQIVMVLIDEHGPGRVDAAVQSLMDDQRRFPWPNDARKALVAILGDPPAKDKPNVLDDAQRAQMAMAERGLDHVRGVLADAEEDPAERKRVLERVKKGVA